MIPRCNGNTTALWMLSSLVFRTKDVETLGHIFAKVRICLKIYHLGVLNTMFSLKIIIHIVEYMFNNWNEWCFNRPACSCSLEQVNKLSGYMAPPSNWSVYYNLHFKGCLSWRLNCLTVKYAFWAEETKESHPMTLSAMHLYELMTLRDIIHSF